MIKKYWILVLLITYSFIGLGQPGGGGDPGSGEPVPISGIEYLLAAGAALGVRKWFNARKKKHLV